MTNIVNFHTAESAADKFFNSTEMKDWTRGSIARMQATMANPKKSERTKLEAKMIIAIHTNNDQDFYRITGILDRLNKTGISIAK